MKLTLTVLISLLLCSPLYALDNSPPSPNAEEHYCDDGASWQEWEQLLIKYPDDDKISSLYAFRVGLCSMVKSGQIEIQRATRLFERMREVILRGSKNSKQKKIL